MSLSLLQDGFLVMAKAFILYISKPDKGKKPSRFFDYKREMKIWTEGRENLPYAVKNKIIDNFLVVIFLKDLMRGFYFLWKSEENNDKVLKLR